MSNRTSLIVAANGQEHRPVHFDGRPLVMDVLAGETLALPATIVSFETISKPAGSTVTRSENGRTLTLGGVGHYFFRAYTQDDAVDLRFLVIEQAAHDWIPERPASPGRMPNDRRAILRSLANHAPTFDGTRETLMPLNLTAYGG